MRAQTTRTMKVSQLATKYTVVGYHDAEGRKHVIGVVHGPHVLRGGYPPYEGGIFAEVVVAESWMDAEAQVHGKRDEPLEEVLNPEVPC